MFIKHSTIAYSLSLATATLLAGCGGAPSDSGSSPTARQAGVLSGQMAGGGAQAAFVPPQDADRIAAGSTNTVALRTDGTVFVWGGNAYGQLANRSGKPSLVPLQVTGLSGVRAVRAGAYHVLALAQDGSVWAWGSNSAGQLGQAGTIPGVPAKVPGLSNVTVVTAGQAHSTAVAQNGSVWGWGALPGRASVAAAQVKELNGVKSVVAGGNFNLALKADGTVWGWGGNSNGQVGAGYRTALVATPVRVANVDKVVALAAGSVHALALRNDGSVWSWGSNNFGQLGFPGESAVPHAVKGLPVPVNGASGVKAIAAGAYNSAVLYADGSVWAWGDNSAGQLGNGTTANAGAPVRINSVANIAALSIGERFIVLVAADGRAYALGANADGQLGNNTVSRAKVPVQVVGLSGVGYLNLGQSTSH